MSAQPRRFTVSPFGTKVFGTRPECGWRVVDTQRRPAILAVYPTESEALDVARALNANAYDLAQVTS